MSTVFGGAVNDTAPTAKVPSGVRFVQVEVGRPLVSAPHTCAVKAVLPAEATSTPVRVYPDAFEPVPKPCAPRSPGPKPCAIAFTKVP